MNRIDRLNAIMIYMQSKLSVTLDQLEERFELSRRTLFRDIRSLQEAGVPIGGDAGKGYFIVEGCLQIATYDYNGNETTIDLAFEQQWRC